VQAPLAGCGGRQLAATRLASGRNVEGWGDRRRWQLGRLVVVLMQGKGQGWAVGWWQCGRGDSGGWWVHNGCAGLLLVMRVEA
jgi:hypothetical protein